MRRGEGKRAGDDAASLDRAVGALLGLAIGDALGAPVEGRERDSYPRMTDFTGGGTYGLAAGEWTDDTAMAICLAESLLAQGALDEAHLLQSFLRWYRLGENACGGRAVGISEKTRRVLEAFEENGSLDAARGIANAGNGCLMRLAPLAIFHQRAPETACQSAERQARLTHTAAEAVASAGLLAELLAAALAGGNRAAVLAVADRAAHPSLAALAGGGYRGKERSRISSAPRALDTLEAALWCLGRASDFESALIEAVNLGGDSDTIGAVTGQLAGALFGAGAIPRRWIDGLHSATRIADLAGRLHARAFGAEMSIL